MRTRLIGSFTIFAATALPALAAEMPNVPDALAIKGGKVVASVTATGTQVYECARTPKGQFAWSFREPKADLMLDGKPIGKHFAGPTWEFSDGTRLTARAAAKAPGKATTDIPWLKLDVVQRTKKGPAAGSKYVLRVDTKGGALSGACTTDKEMRAEPYQATYVFVK